MTLSEQNKQQKFQQI